jgi:hypothetical protein
MKALEVATLSYDEATTTPTHTCTYHPKPLKKKVLKNKPLRIT